MDWEERNANSEKIKKAFVAFMREHDITISIDEESANYYNEAVGITIDTPGSGSIEVRSTYINADDMEKGEVY